jgi:4'-phosphopantetheinyl transferase
MWLDVDRANCAHFLSLLSPQEKARAEHFMMPLHRRRYIAARGRLRELLASSLHCPPREIVLQETELGKPFVAGSSLRFNLSHDSDLALFVLVRGMELGCDIAWRDSTMVSRGMLRMVFPAAALPQLEALPAEAQVDAFFTVWTCKEALLKGAGTGLLRSPAEFDIGLPPRAHIDLPGEEVEWALLSRRLGNGLYVAVAARSSTCQVDLGELPPRQQAA